MKITKERLAQVVKEELKEVRSPGWRGQKTKTKSQTKWNIIIIWEMLLVIGKN